MPRCKHTTGTLREEYLTASVFSFLNGEVFGVNHDSSEGEYTGRISFECDGCERTFRSTLRSAPKWMLDRYRDAMDHDLSD